MAKKTFYITIALVSCLLLGTAKNCLATCIVIVLRKEGFYVGADSRSRVSKLNTQTKEVTYFNRSICKIHCVGAFQFANSGGFDDKTAEIVAKHCKGIDIQQVVNSYAPELRAFYEEQIELRRQLDPKQFEKRFLREQISDIAFWGYKPSGEVYTFYMRWAVVSKANEKVQVRTEINHNSEVAILGNRDHIYPLKDKPDTWIKGVLPGIKNLINIEMQHHPNDVGGPIDILLVTPRGRKWIECKPECSKN